jgi:hypothetical protein
MRDPLCLGALLFVGFLVALAALTTRPKRCPSCKKRRARELKSRKIPGSDFERQRPGADYRTTETYRYTKYVVEYQCRACQHRWEEVEQRDRRVR